MEITRIGAKRFFCHSSVMWLNTESVPEAFPPLPLAVIISVSSHSLSSVTYYFSLCFISPFIASIFNMTHLRVSFYGVTRNLALYLSSVTRTFYLTFINSFILLKKNILCPLSSFFLSQMGPVAHFLTLPSPSSLLECYLSCFTVVAPCSDCVKRSTPPLYMCIYCMHFCISIYTYPLL